MTSTPEPSDRIYDDQALDEIAGQLEALVAATDRRRGLISAAGRTAAALKYGTADPRDVEQLEVELQALLDVIEDQTPVLERQGPPRGAWASDAEIRHPCAESDPEIVRAVDDSNPEIRQALTDLDDDAGGR